MRNNKLRKAYLKFRSTASIADIVMTVIIIVNIILSILSLVFIKYDTGLYFFNIVIGVCFLIHRYRYIGYEVRYNKWTMFAAILINSVAAYHMAVPFLERILY